MIRIALLAVLGAVVTTTLAAALAMAAGVDFALPAGGETIPLPGFAVVTAFFCAVGTGIALALRRWSKRPATRWVWIAGMLTLISLFPPLLAGGSAGTTGALLVLHLIPAAVMIPLLARGLKQAAG